MTRHWRIFLQSCFFLLNAIFASASVHHKREENAPESAKQMQASVPKLLHYIYLPGYDAFRNGQQIAITQAMIDNFDGCQRLHNHWDSIFWNEDLGRNLLQSHYAWFLPVWEEYDEKDKSHALVFFIMDHYGGMYLHFDIECYKSVDESLRQYDLVLQGSGNAGLSTAVMASAPGHPLWEVLANKAKDKLLHLSSYSGELSFVVQAILIKRPYPVGYVGGVFKHDSLSLRLWPMGEWFEPCFGLDHVCIKMYESKNESIRSLWDTKNIYGRRFFSDEVLQEQTNSQTIDSIILSRQQ